MALSDTAVTSKFSEIGGRVDKSMKEKITVHFVAPCDRQVRCSESQRTRKL